MAAMLPFFSDDFVEFFKDNNKPPPPPPQQQLTNTNWSSTDSSWMSIDDQNDTDRRRMMMNVSTIPDACAYSTLDQPSVRAAFIFAYLFVFGCCCGGNVLLLIVVGVHPAMRTVTNFFLANLAAADLLVALFCVVQNLMHLFVFEQALWPLGEFMCRMYVFVMHLIPCTSAGLLLVLSCERYIAIMHPIAARRLLTKDRLAIIAGVVWAISVVTNVPYYLAADYKEVTDMENVSVLLESDDGNATKTLWRMEPKPGAPTLAWCSRSSRMVIGGVVHTFNPKALFTFSFVVWYILPFMAMLIIYSVIGVTLWKSTGSDSVALTSSGSASGGAAATAGGSGCVQNCRMVKRRSQGGDPISRQVSSSGLTSVTKVEAETELISLSPTDEVWRKKSEEPRHHSNNNEALLRKNLTVAKTSTAVMISNNNNGRQHQQHSISGGSGDPKEAVESRKRVIRLLISIILAFAVLTLPNHLRFLLNVWNPPLRRCNHGFQALVQPLSYLLLFSNSGINPILYAFMSKKFRRAVREIFSRKALREQRRERFLTSIRSTATSEVYTAQTEY